MRFCFLLAAIIGPEFFRRFVLFFVIGLGLFLYCLLHA